MDYSLNKHGLVVHLKISPKRNQKEMMEFAIKVSRKLFLCQWNDSKLFSPVIIYDSVLVTSDVIASWIIIKILKSDK